MSNEQNAVGGSVSGSGEGEATNQNDLREQNRDNQSSNKTEQPKGRREEGYKVKTEAIPDEVKEAAIEKYIPMALEAGLVSFNSYRIKRLYPKAYQKIHDYAFEKAGTQQDAIDDDTVSGILLYTPKSIMFEFLDKNSIYFTVIREADTWGYAIYEHDTNVSADYLIGKETNLETRLEAELKGFEESLRLLESKL